jgi:hypothetical protein
MAREGEKSSFSFIYSRNRRDRLWRGECVLRSVEIGGCGCDSGVAAEAHHQEFRSGKAEVLNRQSRALATKTTCSDIASGFM